MDRETLIEAARAAAAHANAPYSKFRVGAAVVVQTDEGQRVVTGANIENASYGLTLCAERAALASACMLAAASTARDVYPKPTITHIAISCVNADADADASERAPCGACCQWLAELAPRAVYYVDGIPDDLTLTDLLPYAFHLPD
jgi:cytidine deaminase